MAMMVLAMMVMMTNGLPIEINMVISMAVAVVGMQRKSHDCVCEGNAAGNKGGHRRGNAGNDDDCNDDGGEKKQ